MKKNMNIKGLISTAVLLLVLLAACNKIENPAIEDPQALDVNLLRSPKLFESALRERDNETTNIFHIENVNRKGDFLVISLKGGSEAADFKVIWDGQIQLSYPATLRLVIVYEGEEAAFDPDAKLNVKVDLRKIAPDYTDAEQFMFHVLNGSIVAKTVLNPNGTSSNE
ncbi:hypothetical protein [Parapedobacter tibetensis]|uniref:hypothetical protein n=1 Tax=Parapedobacter tibetensis TaxID=2972951 RepID=UPI00214DC70D|nr:hypothetical protein [Parapedobacter tibetensis]